MLRYFQVALVVGLLIGGTAAAQDTSAWDVTNDPGDCCIDVTVGAALASTSFGMTATPTTLATGASAFVEDQTPAHEQRYRMRVYLDPNTLDPGIAQGSRRTRIFTAIDTTTEGSNRRMIMIALRQQTAGGPYAVLARVYRGSGYISPLDGTNYEQTTPVTLSAGEHFLEFDWQRESSPGANNGSFTMWLDDDDLSSPIATLTGIGLNAYGMDTSRLGLIQILAGANGTVFLDEFESRRLNEIGALL
ncbi:MAG: hypothetical protein ACRD2A_24670 [Vicinamibacterales bacterium]